MIVLGIIFAVLIYAFIAKIVYNFSEELFNLDHRDDYYGYNERNEAVLVAIVFPISMSLFLVWQVLKLPFKLADIVCNPKNYKFKINIERRK